MKKNNREIDFIFPEKFSLDDFKDISSKEPFNDESINFLDVLSKELLNSGEAKIFPDVITFAFYCRKANLKKLKEKYNDKNHLRLGIGVVFHIAPSNVPVNFAYSLICGILSGNKNVVRVPSKSFDQIKVIVNAIKKISKQSIFNSFSKSIILVRYDHKVNYSEYFSSLCDVRIIWGGDETISNVRKNTIPARSFDITFADRYSLCIINSKNFLKQKKYKHVAQGFYNDTYLFDQNACTAPHLIVWTGNDNEIFKAKKIFWKNLHDIVKTQHHVQPVIAVDKLTSFYNSAINLEKIKKEDSKDNLLWNVRLDSLDKDIEKYKCNSGFFSEYNAKSINELSTIVNRKYQTLAYYGIEKSELIDFIKKIRPKGIDRIVPIGKTLDFSLTWDGYNLIDMLSRKIDIV